MRQWNTPLFVKIWTKAAILLVVPREQTSVKFEDKNEIFFFRENASENVASDTAAILFKAHHLFF